MFATLVTEVAEGQAPPLHPSLILPRAAKHVSSLLCNIPIARARLCSFGRADKLPGYIPTWMTQKLQISAGAAQRLDALSLSLTAPHIVRASRHRTPRHAPLETPCTRAPYRRYCDHFLHSTSFTCAPHAIDRPLLQCSREKQRFHVPHLSLVLAGT